MPSLSASQSRIFEVTESELQSAFTFFGAGFSLVTRTALKSGSVLSRATSSSFKSLGGHLAHGGTDVLHAVMHPGEAGGAAINAVGSAAETLADGIASLGLSSPPLASSTHGTFFGRDAT